MASGRSKRQALVIVDVQNDFCPGGSLAVAEGDHIVPVINRVSGLFGRVVATKDWHPPRHVSFASRHPGKKPMDRADALWQEQLLWPDHCVAGSRGAELHPGLLLAPVDLILHKGANPDLDSYSAFLENDRRTPTGLEAYLKGLGFLELYFCGLATDVCVKYSVLDAINLGFRAVLIADGVRGVDIPKGSDDQAVREMVAAGAAVVESKEIE
ncbi:MAG TPA: bifunctional nicotinamidase/pyrazinamidase [Spirochaetia bacterium]|nr:bifunctional nicotinamidase/pyrazinamidase [Spirochaetia bacterium]